MAEIPQNIERIHILKALDRIDQEGIPPSAQATAYDLIHGDSLYPPKLVFSWANVFANGQELDRKEFPGGLGAVCFRLLENEGFTIEKRPELAELYKLWDEFLEAWPVSRIKGMQLEEYSSVGDKNSFCNWIESRSDKLGSIWGGSSFKFGVFNRSDRSEKPESKRYTYTDNYAWESKLGASADEAFAAIKGHILSIISSVRAGTLGDIEFIPLWPVFKWKIAFLYQDRQSSLLPAVFKVSHLAAYIDAKGFDLNTPFSQLYEEVMLQDGGDDVLAFGREIWSVAENRLGEKNVAPVEKGMKQPLNQILYGPPGTGKTYNTVNKALEILDPVFLDLNKSNRGTMNARFKVLQEENRIGFVTFHQSFSYEDFVEGLRATTDDGQITYEIADGVFKQICEMGEPELEKASEADVNVSGRKIWKMSLGNTLGSDSYIYEHCIENNELRLGYGREIDFSGSTNREGIISKFESSNVELEEQDFRVTAVDNFRAKMNVGDLVVISDGNVKFRAIAEILGEYQCLPNADLGHYAQTRKVIWHRVYEKSLPYERIMDKKFSQMTIYKLKPKTINMNRFQALLHSKEFDQKSVLLRPGRKLGDSRYEVVSVSDELIRVKAPKTGSIIAFDVQMIDELVGYVNNGDLTVEDIAQKRVFEKVDTNIEKYIVNGYPSPISKVVGTLTSRGVVSEPTDGSNDNKRVLIIDEINRGNISSIFGELITLIEPSKRAGAKEALSVTLPYSKETFQVPDNLYLIGTMNTADRSLALMDTALRRRFDFVEMMPDVGVLKDLTVEGIDIAAMLTMMNRRIEVLYDREHTLGHAFFIPLLDLDGSEGSLAMLQNIFANKILPLLEEYFFEDWEKIRLVLGDNQKKDRQDQFVTENQEGFNSADLFGLDTGLDYEVEEAKSYSRNDAALTRCSSYVGIYER